MLPEAFFVEYSATKFSGQVRIPSFSLIISLFHTLVFISHAVVYVFHSVVYISHTVGQRNCAYIINYIHFYYGENNKMKKA